MSIFKRAEAYEQNCKVCLETYAKKIILSCDEAQALADSLVVAIFQANYQAEVKATRGRGGHYPPLKMPGPPPRA